VSNSRRRVLVTGARLPAALEIARALAEAGAEVWAADSLIFSPTRASKAVRGYFQFPSPAMHPQAFQETLLHQVRRLGITQIVPVSEEVFFLAAMRRELGPHATLFAPPLDCLRRLHSKWSVLELARDCGARIPDTHRAENSADLRELLRAHPDYLAKPEYSRGAYHARFAPHAADWNPPPATFPWLVQERIAGREISTAAIVSEGSVLVQVSYLPRYRAGAGASLYFEPVASPAAEWFVAEFAARHTLTGHLGFDFIESNGELTLLECNPRATSGVHLFPAHARWGSAYQGMKIESPERAEARCSKLGVLATHSSSAIAGRRFRALREDLARARDSCFQRADPLPALALPLSGLEIALRSLAWPVKTRHAYTYDLEWNGAP
jgi:hypothetical protein